MTGDERIVDPGAQGERTVLAWNRTVAALIVALLIVVRVAQTDLGAYAVVLLVIGAPVATGLLVAAQRRYRRARSAIRAGGSLPDMRLPAVLAAMCMVLGLVEAVRLLVA